MRHVILALLLLVASDSTAQPLTINFKASFTAAQQHMLRNWVNQGVSATTDVVGELPFTLHVDIYYRQGEEPVPWAHTRKGQRKSVHLYVNPRYSAKEFKIDWTLYHELSHMALPYLGEQQRWLAEGFASFMQYQLMAHQGVLNQAPNQLYRQRLAQYRDHYGSQNAQRTAQQLINQRLYPPAYWLGASLFADIDQQLKRLNTRVSDVIRRYIHCCLRADVTAEELFHQLDRLAPAAVFSSTLARYQQQHADEIATTFLRRYK